MTMNIHRLLIMLNIWRVISSSVSDSSHFGVDPHPDPHLGEVDPNPLIHLSEIVDSGPRFHIGKLKDPDPGLKWIRIRVPIFH